MGELQRNQPCGCIVCMCEDEEQCHGCGAKNCGTHPVGQFPNPVYVNMTDARREPVTREQFIQELDTLIGMPLAVEFDCGDGPTEKEVQAQYDLVLVHDAAQREHYRALADRIAVYEAKYVHQDLLLEAQDQLEKLQASYDADMQHWTQRLAASEAQVKELEHEANQEGQQFRQFAQEILPPGMCVATEGAISFGKLKEVVETAIAIPTRELAKLEQRLAEVERERDEALVVKNAQLVDAQATIARLEDQLHELTREGGEVHSLNQHVARLREALEVARQSLDQFTDKADIAIIDKALRETGA